MNDFFTWTILATYAGATLATTLVTQLLKGIGFIDRIPTRIFSYVIALIILLAATFFTGALTWDTAALCVVNAVVVSLAANGAFDAVTAKHTNDRQGGTRQIWRAAGFTFSGAEEAGKVCGRI